MNEQKEKRKSYNTPELTMHGTLAELTQTGFSQPGMDGSFNKKLGYEGSVYPPGNPFSESGSQ